MAASSPTESPLSSDDESTFDLIDHLVTPGSVNGKLATNKDADSSSTGTPSQTNNNAIVASSTESAATPLAHAELLLPQQSDKNMKETCEKSELFYIAEMMKKDATIDRLRELLDIAALNEGRLKQKKRGLRDEVENKEGIIHTLEKRIKQDKHKHKLEISAKEDRFWQLGMMNYQEDEEDDDSDDEEEKIHKRTLQKYNEATDLEKDLSRLNFVAVVTWIYLGLLGIFGGYLGVFGMRIMCVPVLILNMAMVTDPKKINNNIFSESSNSIDSASKTSSNTSNARADPVPSETTHELPNSEPRTILLKGHDGYFGFYIISTSISRVDEHGAARREGLLEGDQIISINDVNVEYFSKAKIEENIRAAKDEIKFVVRYNPERLQDLENAFFLD